MKVYELPPWMPNWIDKHLKGLGFALNRPKELAKAIMSASNNYQSSDSTTPWGDPKGQAAYLAYFFPLNYIRSLKVIDEAKHWNLFDGVSESMDFGCGPGTFSKALLQDADINIDRITGVDNHRELASLFLDSTRQRTELQFQTEPIKPRTRQSLLIASYVLNEISDIPRWLIDFKRIIVMEPSTKQMFPKLQDLRDHLIDKGYNIVAPCPHHLECPLSQSKKDWCHDRVHWQQPSWFEKIENELPIKNRTLSFSYLIVTREPVERPDYWRVVGDDLVEKGKTRWMLCRNENREFLSHLKRQGKAPEVYRGDRIHLKEWQLKGQEIRFEKENLTQV